MFLVWSSPRSQFEIPGFFGSSHLIPPSSHIQSTYVKILRSTVARAKSSGTDAALDHTESPSRHGHSGSILESQKTHLLMSTIHTNISLQVPWGSLQATGSSTVVSLGKRTKD